jgi:hypothetical protein
LERLSRLDIGHKNHVLIFTHQCNTDFLTELLNEYQKWGILTGENITLQSRGMDFDIVDFPQEITNEGSTKWVLAWTKIKFNDVLK